MHHHHERVHIVFTVVQPVQCPVRDDVCRVAFVLCFSFSSDELRIRVSPLPGEDFPLVKSLHGSVQVNFPDHRCLIAVLLKDLLKLLLIVIEAAAIVELSIEMTVLAGEQRGSAGSANRVADIGSVKDDASAGNTVDVWRQVF